ncbi:O-antigen ligase family protein [Tautonia sp. JC769]|uniref:O-antigen ligase family protein n=1 Tax=Tautonia sp. JC769 TaxID=3232135 RepID=UPI003458E305
MSSLLIMAFASHLGPLSIVAFFALWMSTMLPRGKVAITIPRNCTLTVLFVLWCILSSIWSKHTNTSLYKALEFGGLALFSLVIAEKTSPKSFIHGIRDGAMIVLALTLASGRYGGDPFTGEHILVGYFGSKNMVGLFAQIAILAALLTFGGSRNLVSRCFSLLGILLGLLCLVQSKSATSLVGTLATAAILATLYAITRLPRHRRKPTLLIAGTIAAGLATVAVAIDLKREVLRALGKSTNLTGRTELWNIAWAQGMESPFIGHGYQSFWVKGNILAEHMWYKFGIWGKTGFHFHNLYYQVFVDLGIVGVALITSILFLTLLRGVFLLLRHGMRPEYTIAVAFASMFAIRSFSEVDIIGTFSIGIMLFYALPPRLRAPRADDGPARTPTPIPGIRRHGASGRIGAPAGVTERC